jgi:UDP-N-acetylmuramate: L-alanyl-gamma-D-glutamyl-meso-diaminopimelate ligase
LIVNNIEYDHADIFSDVDAIIWQFHQLLRTVPGNGLIVANGKDANIEKLLKRGVWTPVATFSASDRAARWFGVYDLVGMESRFSVFEEGAARGSGRWSLLGQHNLENALAAIAAACHVGVAPVTALQALAEFKGVKRRLELRGSFAGITLYEDFAHHPTAIAMTLQGVRSLAPQRRIVAVMEPRSNTMRMGVHRDTLHGSFAAADRVFVLAASDLGFDPKVALAPLGERLVVAGDVQSLLKRLLAELTAGDHVVLMSNGSFQGLPRLLEQALEGRVAT